MAKSSGDLEVQHGEPLLNPRPSDGEQNSLMRQIMNSTFKSSANLANLLPTGTVLAFQLLSPIFTNQGRCDIVYRYLTSGLVALCGLSCLVISFTDSFKDDHGMVRYVFATFNGLWVIDGSPSPPPQVAATYKIKFIDFLHAFMSLLVFAAVALLDKNVVTCLYPIPSDSTEEILKSLPIGIGVICSMLFVTFPTIRHGIGFPIAPR